LRVVAAEALPDVLDRVELRAVGRKHDEGDVVRDDQRMAAVPAGPVEHEHGISAGATERAVSARRPFIAPVSAKGMTRPTATPRSGLPAAD
jgi:hypothetical protein